MKFTHFILLVALFVGLSSCVSSRKYESMSHQSAKTDSLYKIALTRIETTQTAVDSLTMANLALAEDTLRKYYTIEKIKDRIRRLTEDGSAETARMMRQLSDNRKELASRASKINALQTTIQELRQKITILESDLNKGVKMPKADSIALKKIESQDKNATSTTVTPIKK